MRKVFWDQTQNYGLLKCPEMVVRSPNSLNLLSMFQLIEKIKITYIAMKFQRSKEIGKEKMKAKMILSRF